MVVSILTHAHIKKKKKHAHTHTQHTTPRHARTHAHTHIHKYTHSKPNKCTQTHNTTHAMLRMPRTPHARHLVLEGLEGVRHVQVEGNGVEEVALVQNHALLPLGHQLAGRLKGERCVCV